MSPRGFLGGLEFELGIGGAGRIRTGDPLLAKQVLCQLSYDPRIGWQLLKKNGGSQNLLCAINWNPDSGTPAFEGGNPFVLRP